MAVTASAAGAAPQTARRRGEGPPGGALPVFRDLFNGKDLTGWVVPAGAEKTWSVRDGVLVCSGRPNGVMRTDTALRELRAADRLDARGAGRNSGLYVWTGADSPAEGSRSKSSISTG